MGMLYGMTEHEKYKMSLECLMLERECVKKNRGMWRKQSQLEQMPTGHIDDNLSIKMRNDSNGSSGTKNKNPWVPTDNKLLNGGEEKINYGRKSTRKCRRSYGVGWQPVPTLECHLMQVRNISVSWSDGWKFDDSCHLHTFKTSPTNDLLITKNKQQIRSEET